MFIKALRKLIWIWERERPYFSALHLYELPRVSCCRANGIPSINVLCTPSTLTEAAYSAWSWCDQLGFSFSLRIVVDGRFNSKDAAVLRSLIEGVEITSAFDLIDADLFQFKGLGPLGHKHPMGRKLLLSLSLQRHEDHIYSDNDVLIFNYPEAIVSSLQRHDPAYNQESTQPCYSEDILNRASDLGLHPCRSLNGGLLFFPKHSINIELANELALAKLDADYSWFDEQTIFSVLMNQASAQPLSKDHYVVNTQRQFWPGQDVDYTSIVSRHFTSPVRHLMYAHGYPILRSTRH
jgi:hypothetical protein